MSTALPTPLVSVIVPMYNSAATVAQTVASVLAQSIADWELIVVNDGSTDDGAAIVARATAGDARVRVITQANAGLAGARNTGLAAARGRFVNFLDADDWLEPTGLADLTAAALASRSPAAVGGVRVCDNDGRLLTTHRPTLTTIGLDELLDRAFFSPNAHVSDRAALGSLRFDESLRVVEDLDMWTRLAESGVQWTTTPAVVAGYRVRPGSLSKQGPIMLATTLRVRGEAFDRVINRVSQQPGAPSARTALAVRKLAALRAAALDITARTALLGADHTTPRDAAATAFQLLESHLPTLGGRWTVSPAAAGAAAASAWIWGAGARPATAGHTETDQRSQALAEFWHALHRAGMAAPGLATAAAEHQRRALLDTDAVAAELAARIAATGAAQAILIGAGRNGQALARELLSLGIAVAMRDDRPDAALPPHCTRQIMDAPLAPGAAVVLTPTDADALARRFAGVQGLLRWGDAAAELTTPAQLAPVGPSAPATR